MYCKKRTLERLALREESRRTYAIDREDLLYLDRCALCGSSSLSLIAEVYLQSSLNFFSTCVCENCLYVFRTVSPNLQWFEGCWKAIASESLEVFNPEVEDIRMQRYDAYHTLLTKYVQTGKCLDIGAAYGTGTKLFRDRGFDAVAVEPEDNKANYIVQALGLPMAARSVTDCFQLESNYDLIIFAHCLEHLDDPAFVMKHMRGIMTPGAIVYLEVPLVWNFVDWSDAFFLTHKSNFSEENVLNLASGAGFEVLETTYFRHTEDEPWDFGLVLRANETDLKIQLRRNEKRTVDDVVNLYRKNMPLKQSPPSEQVLKYSVPYIDHFYQTITLDRHCVVEPQQGCSFMRLEQVQQGCGCIKPRT